MDQHQTDHGERQIHVPIFPGPWLSSSKNRCTDENKEGEPRGEEWVRSDNDDGMNEQIRDPWD